MAMFRRPGWLMPEPGQDQELVVVLTSLLYCFVKSANFVDLFGVCSILLAMLRLTCSKMLYC